MSRVALTIQQQSELFSVRRVIRIAAARLQVAHVLAESYATRAYEETKDPGRAREVGFAVLDTLTHHVA